LVAVSICYRGFSGNSYLIGLLLTAVKEIEQAREGTPALPDPLKW